MPLGVGAFGQQFFGNIVGLVVVLAFLVHDHAPLHIDLDAVQPFGQEAHAVGFQPKHPLQTGLGEGFVEVGPVVVGGGVVVAPTHCLEDGIEVVPMLGTGEHDVFKQVGKSCLARFFIFTPHVVVQTE